jgi:flagellar protein FliO/FliZ
MFDSLFGTEGSLIVRFVVAFVIVLGLIALTFWLIRRFGGARIGAAAARGRAPRLAVVDAAPVDGRRRLVLVRRDNVEHLLMIGGPTDIVVEENIVRAVPVTQPRDTAVPRTPGAVEAASATRNTPDEWPAPEPAPPPRAQPEPPRPGFGRAELPAPRSARPDPLARATEALLGRPSPPPTLTPSPRPSEPPLVPAVEPEEPRPISPPPSRPRPRRTGARSAPTRRHRTSPASRNPCSTASKRKWRACSAARPARSDSGLSHSRVSLLVEATY